MATKKFEIVKRDSIIKIEVSATAYYVFKEHMLKLLEKYNTTELLAKIVNTPDELEDDEYSIKILLDVIAEVEKSAIARKQTEFIDITVVGGPEEEEKEEPKDPS
jgi:hypothetical protein